MLRPFALFLVAALLSFAPFAPASAQDDDDEDRSDGEAGVVYVDAEGIERGVVTVDEVEDPFEDYREDRPPDEDTRYVLLTVAFEATGDESFEASPSDLLLRDADGFLWGNRSVPREDDAFPELSSQTLAPGNRISGVVGFIVPEDAELVEVFYQPESGRLIRLADLREDPVPGPEVGTELEYADAEGAEGLITVSEIEDPFEGNPEDRPPAADARYVLLTVAFENTGERAFDASPSQLVLRDADGFLWGHTSVPREDDALPELRSHTMAPGNRISGVVGFIVPEDAELVQIYYQPESGRLIVLADLVQDADRGAEEGAEEGAEDGEDDAAEDADEEEGEAAAAVEDAEVWESPHYGYTLAYDPEEWEVLAEDDDPDDEYDQFFFTNGTSRVTLVGDPDYGEDELDRCLADYHTSLEAFEARGTYSGVAPLAEPDAAGEEDGRAWATYAYTREAEAGDAGDFVRFYECRWLGDGVTLVVVHDAPAADYGDEVAAREELLAGLELPETEA